MDEITTLSTKRPLVLAAAKFLVLVLLFLTAVGAYQLTPAREFLSADILGQLLREFGAWAPVLFIVAEAISIVFFMPASIPIALGGVLFGPIQGFVYGWLGAVAGAGMAFLVGRALGRDFTALLIGKRLQRFDDALARHGFATVLYARMLNTPFTPMNYGFSLTKVGFFDFFFGTSLGVLLSVFVITFLSGTIKVAWVSGKWQGLLSPEVAFAAGLFVFSFFVPLILKKIRNGFRNARKKGA